MKLGRVEGSEFRSLGKMQQRNAGTVMTKQCNLLQASSCMLLSLQLVVLSI